MLALSCGFGWCIGLRPDGGWYSPSWVHRLQTEAFFRGTLALQPVPHGQMADWVWAAGSHQVWGLGIPFIRFPLEALAKVCGAVGFPDRVTLWLAFVGVAAVLRSAFAGLGAWERACLLAMTAFPPAFVTLCRTRLAVYEEASAYACLCGLLLGGLLLRLAAVPARRTLWVLCLVAGFGPFFRPTLLFTAGATVAIAAPLAWRRLHDRGVLLVSLGCLAIGPVVWCVVNQRRFGSPFETGQLLNVSYIPLDQFSKVFGYPFWYEPWRSAVAELLSSLFLATGWNGVDWYQAGIHPWQSETVRFREFYFWTFDPADGVVLVLSWIVIGWAAATRWPDDARVRVAGLWSASVFAMLFAFYLWAPSMTSRYAVDFVPAFAIGSAGLWMWCFGRVTRHPALTILLALGGLAWVAYDVARAEISPSHATQSLVTADVVRERLPHPNLTGEPLPAAYRCGEDPERFGVKFNGSGWAARGDCSVDPGSMFLLPHPDCLRVQVAAVAGAPPLTTEQIAVVRAKIGLTELARVRDEPLDDGVALTFCAPPGRVPLDPIELVYFGWMDPRLVRRGSRPLRLLQIETVTR